MIEFKAMEGRASLPLAISLCLLLALSTDCSSRISRSRPPPSRSPPPRYNPLPGSWQAVGAPIAWGHASMRPEMCLMRPKACTGLVHMHSEDLLSLNVLLPCCMDTRRHARRLLLAWGWRCASCRSLRQFKSQNLTGWNGWTEAGGLSNPHGTSSPISSWEQLM